MSDFYLSKDQPILWMDCEAAFNGLTEKEKLYAHYLSQASWVGGLIKLFQVSPESPLIFSLLHNLYRHEPFDELKHRALDTCGFTEEDFGNLLAYTTGFLDNIGNYKCFGATKFVPNVSKEKFRRLVLESKASQQNLEKVHYLLDKCLDKMFSTEDSEKQLGYWDVGVTKYHSKNFLKKDSEIVNAFLKAQNIEVFNSRVFKTVDETGNSCYEIRFASSIGPKDAESDLVLSTHTQNGHKFVVTRGDYSPILELVDKELQLAKLQVSNDLEAEMIGHYITSFKTGSIDSHKDGSRCWVKNKDPIVETYIGFIETYVDPAGMRGEFEGFVALVNKELSVKFANLVANAEEFLPLLPWPSSYEKDKFLRPDFTSLDVVTFSGFLPSAICIPNYDEIRQNEGFKNVFLGNVTAASWKTKNPNFLSSEDKVVMEQCLVPAYEVHCALHELLGHGSGKMFMEKNGELNFDVENVEHLETGTKLTSWYKEGEGYESVFTSLSSSYEECRAECVGLYLCSVQAIQAIFGHQGPEVADLIYVTWLAMCHKGLSALEMYETKTKSWMQAHAHARYVIFQVLLEAGQDFVVIKETRGEDGSPDLLLTVDRSKIVDVGRPALGAFLRKLQLYKCTADIAKAKAMFDHYSAVNCDGKYPFLKYKDIVMARKKPQRVFVQPNTYVKDGKVVMRTYEATNEGMIESWINRYENTEEIDDILVELYKKDEPHF